MYNKKDKLCTDCTARKVNYVKGVQQERYIMYRLYNKKGKLCTYCTARKVNYVQIVQQER